MKIRFGFTSGFVAVAETWTPEADGAGAVGIAGLLPQAVRTIAMKTTALRNVKELVKITSS
ncbi:MAG: hypothetical protein V1489_02825, partial [Candidatus Liptonbacteria bacterium]